VKGKLDVYEGPRNRGGLPSLVSLLLVAPCPPPAAAAEDEPGGAFFGATDERQPVGTAPPLPRISRTAVEGGRVELTLVPAAAQQDLPDRAFQVLLDDQERQASVTGQAPDDVEVMLVVDPMAGRALPSVQGALADFVRALPNGSQVGVVAAGPRPKVVTQPVSDDAQVLQSISGLRADDERDPYGAVDLALDQFSPGRSHGRFLVFVSAGGYPVDGRFGELEDRFATADVDTYVLQLDRAFLGVVTPRWPFAMGAGRILVVGATTDPASLIDDVVDEILSQRFLSFDLAPDETDVAPVVRIDDPSGPVDVFTILRTVESPGGDFGLPDEQPRQTPRKTIGLIALAFALVVAVVLLPPRLRRRRQERGRRPPMAPVPVVPLSHLPDPGPGPGPRQREPSPTSTLSPG
jgi:hypothetical protein